MLTVLAIAAFLAGMTGSWSPCGLSMMATLGPTGHAGGPRTTAAACAAFVPGALLGGAITFGSLALLGSALGGGQVALGIAAAAVLAAAALEARGARIVPQVRRQVPEHWRRVVPLPIAAAGYGLLLGLGFTTFVLTFAVPALAGVALALGEPVAGLVAGLAFGAGRALPVVVLAPLAASATGRRAGELMMERAGILRGFRVADAAALLACALLLGAESADAAAAVVLVARYGSDPSLAGPYLAWQTPGGPGRVRHDGVVEDLAGTHPAVGGPHLAERSGAVVRVTAASDRRELLVVPDAGLGPIAVSGRWLVVRVSDALGERLDAISLADGSRRTVAGVQPPVQLGRPALDGDRLVFHVASSRSSRVRAVDLVAGTSRTLRSTNQGVLLNPSLSGERLLYVHSTAERQRLLVGARAGRGDGTADRSLYSIAPTARRDPGHEPGRGPHRTGYPGRRPRALPVPPPSGVTRSLWTTAIGPREAYVARLRHMDDGSTASVLLGIDLAG